MVDDDNDNRPGSRNRNRHQDDDVAKTTTGSAQSVLLPPSSSVVAAAAVASRSNSFRISQTLRSITTRIRVANQLSMAKRVEEHHSTVTAGGLLLEEPGRSAEASKLINELTPTILSHGRSFRVQPVATVAHTDENENHRSPRSPNGVISTGNLVFDVAYPLVSERQTTLTRPYICVRPDVELTRISRLMFDQWQLSLPRIALFLLTDADQLRTWNNARQISSFKTGVMKAARTTSMWIVTNGLDVGVAKLIGDALLEEQRTQFQALRSPSDQWRKPVPVIGITDRRHLAYGQSFRGQSVQLANPGSLPGQRRYELNPMHTNFVVIETTADDQSSSSSSSDSYHRLVVRIIDHFTCRKNIPSPEMDEHHRFTPPPPPPSSANAGDNRPSPAKSNQSDLWMVQQSMQQHQNQPEENSGDTVDRRQDLSDSDESSAEMESHSFVSAAGRQETLDGTSGGGGFAIKPPSAAATTTATPMIPVVCLVIQGDYHCAKLVLDNIRRRNPVIVLRGSGGLADLLSFTYIEMQHRCRDLYHAWDAEFVEQTLKPLLAEKIVKRFPEFRNNALVRNSFRDRIIECVRESGSTRGRVYLSILNMHNSSCDLTNLPEFILLSLFKSQHRRDKADANLIHKDLYLTLDWNCPTVALDEVLSRHPAYNLQLDKSLFELAVLKPNREDFVDLFLSHGFRVHKHLTPFRLMRLIRYSLLESDFFRSVCMEAILGIAVWSNNFEQLLERLATSDSTEAAAAGRDSENFILNELNQLIFTTASLHDFISVQDMYMNIMGMYPVDADSAERKALAVLAMWALFNRRFRLAQVLWKHSDQPIHLGLILSTICDRTTWFVSEQNLKDELQTQSKTFARGAIKVLDTCYRQDEQRAFDLLSQRNTDWDRQTAADIAANGSHRAFIAHPCCQKWLTNTFNGRIRVRELSWGIITIPPTIKIILSAFFIFPMYIWIRFLEADSRLRIDKNRLLEELQENMPTADVPEDEVLLTTVAANNDMIPMVPLKKHMYGNKNGTLSALLDHQTTLASIDENTRSMLVRLSQELKKAQERRDKSSAYERERRNLFIGRQPPLCTMIRLLWNSPVTKFWTYHVFYIVYLALLSLALILPGCGNWYLDSAVCIWIFLNIIEHISRMFVLYRRYNSVPMLFRVLEAGLLIVFFLTYAWGRVVVVYSYHVQQGHHLLTQYNIDPYSMKVILSAGLLYFYYRLFYIYLPISSTLGPLLYRFKLMVSVDFIHFMRMALILLISSGIVIQAVLYPNTELSAGMFHKAFHRTIVSLFTTPVEELTTKCTPPKPAPTPPTSSPPPDNSSSFSGSSWWLIGADLSGGGGSVSISAEEYCPAEPIPMWRSCPVSGFWSYVFFFQYLICMKLMLMTLLYALFSATATKLQAETDNIWKFQRYILVVDFANRPALHAPLSLFKYLYLAGRLVWRLATCNRCRWLRRRRMIGPTSKSMDAMDAGSKDGAFLFQNADTGDTKRILSKEDYNFWRHLAKTIYEEERRAEQEKNLPAKQFETIQLICEEVEHEKNIIRTFKTKMNELQRMMYQMQLSLENIKSGTVRRTNQWYQHPQWSSSAPELNVAAAAAAAAPGAGFAIHHLARLSPYVGTRIQRFPVADKYVSWDVNWINYDPVIYSRKRDNFPAELRPWVDEDLLALMEQAQSIVKPPSSSGENHRAHLLPVFHWNMVSVNPAGLTIDRRSWIQQRQQPCLDCLDCNLSAPATPAPGDQSMVADQQQHLVYKLDEEGIPLNPVGRTGFRGKGNLPRWGPNHYVMVLVSRSRPAAPAIGAGQPPPTYQFALEQKFNSLFCPVRFVGDDDRIFADLHRLFGGPAASAWKTETDVIGYFRSVNGGGQTAQVFDPVAYYMDSPENTDNAWKEVKVFHFHFEPQMEPVTTDGGGGGLTWHDYDENMLVQMPMEQVPWVTDAVRRLHQQQPQQPSGRRLS